MSKIDQKKITRIPSSVVNEIYDLFTTESLLQSAFKKRLSYLDIQYSTISGADVDKQAAEVFIAKWVTPLIFDVASMICMFGAIQFKLVKERFVSKYANKQISELDTDGTKNHNEFKTLVPRVSLFTSDFGVYEENGRTMVVPMQDDRDDKKDKLYMLKDPNSIGIVLKTSNICSDVGVLVPSVKNLYEMRRIHRQVRIDSAFPPVFVQQERKTDFHRTVIIKASQLNEENDLEQRVNDSGKRERTDIKSINIRSKMTSKQIEAVFTDPDDRKRNKQSFDRDDDNSDTMVFAVDNQYFLPDGYHIAPNAPQPRLVFDLSVETNNTHSEINRVFNLVESTVNSRSTVLSVGLQMEIDMQQKEIQDYKRQLEQVLRELWIFTQDLEEYADVHVNIPVVSSFARTASSHPGTSDAPQ